MMMARPRTAGAAARRKQQLRAQSAARARANGQETGSRPSSAARAQSAKGSSRPRSASVTPDRGVGNGVANGNAGSGAASTNPGPSMVIPKVLMVLFVMTILIGGIIVAMTSLEDVRLGSTKLVGICIMAASTIFLVAAIVVCMCKRIYWAADHLPDGTPINPASRRPNTSSRRSRYHVGDESMEGRRTSGAWNIETDGGADFNKHRPVSAMSSRSASGIEMTLNDDRQNQLFSGIGEGVANGGFVDADDGDKMVFRTTPQIRITCEDDVDSDDDVRNDKQVPITSDSREENPREEIAVTADVEGHSDLPAKDDLGDVIVTGSSDAGDIKIEISDKNNCDDSDFSWQSDTKPPHDLPMFSSTSRSPCADLPRSPGGDQPRSPHADQPRSPDTDLTRSPVTNLPRSPGADQPRSSSFTNEAFPDDAVSDGKTYKTRSGMTNSETTTTSFHWEDDGVKLDESSASGTSSATAWDEIIHRDQNVITGSQGLHSAHTGEEDVGLKVIKTAVTDNLELVMQPEITSYDDKSGIGGKSDGKKKNSSEKTNDDESGISRNTNDDKSGIRRNTNDDKSGISRNINDDKSAVSGNISSATPVNNRKERPANSAENLSYDLSLLASEGRGGVE